MDKIDKKILEILQRDCSISNQELAERVGLSASPCLRRVKSLEGSGYIEKKVALLCPRELGLNLTVLVVVGMGSHQAKIMNNFKDKILSYPEVLTCHLVTGQPGEFILKIMVHDLEAYQKFMLNKLTQIEGLSNIVSSFVLESVKDSTHLPI